jgi:hypothetical protein
LVEACNGDANLRRCVERLLSAHPTADRIIPVLARERLASISKDKTVTVWDAQNMQGVQHLKGPNGYPAFSPEGMRLATVSSDNSVKVWNAQSGHEQHTLKGDGRRVTKFAFSPGGKHLAIARFGEKGGQGLGCANGSGIIHSQGTHRRSRRPGLQPGRQTPRHSRT